ncbi:hypothetical protein GJ744_009705 [Endocarpon pusillum]|uniref:Myb-like domain-containing protein n=1 Tax=Endocarpon pusillum TaxID=364733 RepID=A0A8H7AS00_9EURO|nr:hypothetical protein GJ744_009705 [Endocarpon pusillum]
MLLPSALPIDTFHQSHRPACTSTPPLSNPGGFGSLSSCRALQAILGSRPASPLSFILSTAPKPIKEKTASYGTRNEQQLQRPPLQPLTPNTKVPTRSDIQPQEMRRPPVSEPCRARKRTRADFETPDENNRFPNINSESESGKIDSHHFSFHHSMSTTTYPPPPPRLYRDQNQDRETFSTPKRPRRIPLLMPLGLSASDFEGLDPTPKAHSKPCVVEHNIQLLPTITGTAPHAASVTDDEWSTADDHLLVSTVLDKLNLSHKMWNECGRRNIATDGDSLGKRWRVLVRDRGCEAGLRRGSGERCRGRLREDWRA